MTGKTVDAFIERDFKDSGTEEQFKGGKVLPLSEGAFINYQAAGLVRVPTDEELKAAKAAADTKADAKKA